MLIFFEAEGLVVLATLVKGLCTTVLSTKYASRAGNKIPKMLYMLLNPF